MDVNIQKELENIIKEGSMEKQSRFLKSWRERWFVLTNEYLMTFKERRVYNNPTQIISLRTITSIRSSDQQSEKPYGFRIDTDDQSFFVAAASTTQKQQWIGQIGKAMVKLNTKNNQEAA